MTTHASSQSVQRQKTEASHFATLKAKLESAWAIYSFRNLPALVGVQSDDHRSAPDTTAGQPSASAKPRV